jgi:peroxiredoxin
VVGVLAQNREAVRRYVEETGLPFDILIDERREMVKAYGVWHPIGLTALNISHPAVFLVNQDATIAYSFIGDNQTEFPAMQQILDAAGT